MIVMMRMVAPHPRYLVLPTLLGLVMFTIVAAQPDESTPLLHALDVMESDHSNLCPVTLHQGDLGSRIVKLADQAGDEIPTASAERIAVHALNDLIFKHLGIRGSPDLKDPCNLLPSAVLERKQGYCVGIAAIYLVLAERLHLPIYAVATPSHVFLRYDDGRTRVNIETLQGGTNIPDEQYIREQRIPEESIRRGVFMRNLTTEEFLAQVYNNLGVIYSERKDYAKAAAEYETALDLNARLPAAFYNYGNDLLRQGQYRRAAQLFSKSLRLYPSDVWALNNRGLAFLKREKREKARKDFEEALRNDPGFEQARKNLEGLATPSESP